MSQYAVVESSRSRKREAFEVFGLRSGLLEDSTWTMLRGVLPSGIVIARLVLLMECSTFASDSLRKLLASPVALVEAFVDAREDPIEPIDAILLKGEGRTGAHRSMREEASMLELCAPSLCMFSKLSVAKEKRTVRSKERGLLRYAGGGATREKGTCERTRE